MGLHFLNLNLLPVEDASSQSSCSPGRIKHLPQLPCQPAEHRSMSNTTTRGSGQQHRGGMLALPSGHRAALIMRYMLGSMLSGLVKT